MEQLNEEQVVDQESIAETQESQANAEVEDRAKKMGWIPKDQFKGDPERWRPADQFVRRADELMPIMRVQLKKYEDKISNLETEVRTTKGTMQKIVSMADKVGQREYERAKADLTKKQVEAVAVGNVEEWSKLEGEKDKLEKPEPVQVEKPMQEPENPQFKTWHVDNDWYLSDSAMTRYANAVASETPKMASYTDWLRVVETAVKEAFPHKFTNAARGKPAAVDGGNTRGGGGGRPRGKSYNDLPSDAKTQADKYVSQGLFKTREDYVKSYYAEEE